MTRGVRDEDDDDGFTVGTVRVIGVGEKSMKVEAVDDDASEHLDGSDQWIPHSQVHENSEVYCGRDVAKKMIVIGKDGKLIVSDWLAKQRGWVE